MTPYKGIVRISCAREKCDGYKAASRATPLLQPTAECITCNRALVEILGLEGDVIARGSKPEAESPKPKTRKPKTSKRA